MLICGNCLYSASLLSVLRTNLSKARVRLIFAKNLRQLQEKHPGCFFLLESGQSATEPVQRLKICHCGRVLRIRFGRGFVVEVAPDHRATVAGFDAEYDFAVLEDSHRAGRLADDNGQCVGRATDGGPGPVSGAKAL